LVSRALPSFPTRRSSDLNQRRFCNSCLCRRSQGRFTPSPITGLANGFFISTWRSPLMTIKKTITLLAAASTTLALVACSDSSSSDDGASPDGGATGGDNYILANGTEPQNPLVPANTNETGAGKIIDSIFSGLVGYDADGETYDEVAESI